MFCEPISLFPGQIGRTVQAGFVPPNGVSRRPVWLRERYTSAPKPCAASPALRDPMPAEERRSADTREVEGIDERWQARSPGPRPWFSRLTVKRRPPNIRVMDTGEAWAQRSLPGVKSRPNESDRNAHFPISSRYVGFLETCPAEPDRRRQLSGNLVFRPQSLSAADFRVEGDADADFVAATRHHVGNDAIHSEDGEHTR
jgi:hypothetical protein